MCGDVMSGDEEEGEQGFKEDIERSAWRPRKRQVIPGGIVVQLSECYCKIIFTSVL